MNDLKYWTTLPISSGLKKFFAKYFKHVDHDHTMTMSIIRIKVLNNFCNVISELFLEESLYLW